MRLFANAFSLAAVLSVASGCESDAAQPGAATAPDVIDDSPDASPSDTASLDVGDASPPPDSGAPGDVAQGDVATGDVAAEDGSAEPDAAPVTDADRVNGGRVYTASCEGCHGADGRGVYGHSLAEKSDETLRSAVRNGNAYMPAFAEAIISDADLIDLIAHIRSFPAPQP
jgi:mono/diheme cytochrome c family protein